MPEFNLYVPRTKHRSLVGNLRRVADVEQLLLRDAVTVLLLVDLNEELLALLVEREQHSWNQK